MSMAMTSSRSWMRMSVTALMGSWLWAWPKGVTTTLAPLMLIESVFFTAMARVTASAGDAGEKTRNEL